MIKITPVKQQTGARFYPGDIARPGAFGGEGRAQERLGSVIGQAVKSLASIFEDNDRLEKVANRKYVQGAIRASLQDSLKYAYQHQKADGSDLVQLYDRHVQQSGVLEKFTKDVDEKEAKFISGIILERSGAHRLGLTQHSIKAGMQAAEKRISDSITTEADTIEDTASVQEYFDHIKEMKDSVKTGLYKDSFSKVEPIVVQKGISNIIYKKIDEITDNALKSKTKPGYDKWNDLEIYTKDHLTEKDLTPEELKEFKELTRALPKEKAWAQYLQSRVLDNKAIGWADLQELSGLEAKSLGTTSKGGSVAEALRRDINAKRKELDTELEKLERLDAAKEKERVKEVELQHKSAVVEMLALNKKTKAKKLTYLFNKGFSHLKKDGTPIEESKLNNVLKKSTAELKAMDFFQPLGGEPLIPPTFAKTVTDDWWRKNKEDAAIVVAKKFGDYVTKPSKKSMSEFTAALENQESTMSPSTTRSYYNWLQNLNNNRLTPIQRNKLNIISKGMMEILWKDIPDNQKTAAKLDFVMETVNKALDKEIEKWNTPGHFTPGMNSDKSKGPGKTDKILEGTGKVISDAIYTPENLQQHTADIKGAYDTIISTLRNDNESLYLKDVGGMRIPYPNSYAPLDKYLAYSIKDIQGLSTAELQVAQAEIIELGNEIHNAVNRKSRYFKRQAREGYEKKKVIKGASRLFKQRMYDLSRFFAEVHKGVALKPDPKMIQRQ